MNTLAGLLLIALGAFASASFYIPFKRVKNIAWEVFWIMGGLFSWVIVPWLVSFLTVPNLFGLFSAMPFDAYIWPFVFGALWGIGGLTFGLTLRYLGVSLGTAIAMGIISALGTLIPPIFTGKIAETFGDAAGMLTLVGVLVSFVGIAFTGLAGINKDKELSEEAKKKNIQDFNLKKGLLVALFSGIMSACFNFGLEAGKPFVEKAIEMGTAPLNATNPLLIIVLAGGFITNFVWCMYLSVKNKTLGDYIKFKNTPVLANWLLVILGGTMWYLQMMFLGMGKSQMGNLEFASWTILMSLVIVFSTMWGFFTKEWSGSGKKTLLYIFIGLAILILSTVIIGLAPQLVA